MDDWWAEVESDILDCLKGAGAMSPTEIGDQIGMSGEAAASLLGILAREGRVRICLVELADIDACPSRRAAQEESLHLEMTGRAQGVRDPTAALPQRPVSSLAGLTPPSVTLTGTTPPRQPPEATQAG